MPDSSHAAAAKGRALTELERENISLREYKQIVRKADRILASCAPEESKKNPTSIAEAYERFHWGEPSKGERVIDLPDFSELYELGEAVAVEYKTSKAGDEAIWVHDFEHPRPKLTATARGELGPIVGGRAHVTERGIEG